MIYESFNGHSYPHESSLRSRRSKFTVRGNTRRAFFGPRASGDSDHFILEFFKNLLMSTPILIRAHVGVIPEAQERRSNEFSLVYHYAATKGLVHLDLPRKIIGLYCDLLFTCLVFVSIKPRKQTHVREGEIARCFLIYVICILYVCVFIPIRSWCQEQKFGMRSRLQHLISSILQHVFRRSLSFPVG